MRATPKLVQLHSTYLDKATELELASGDDLQEITRLRGEIRSILNEIATTAPANEADCHLIVDAALGYSEAILEEHRPAALRALQRVSNYLLTESSGLREIKIYRRHHP